MAYSTSFVIDGINMSIEAIRQIDRIEKVDSDATSGLEMFCYKEGTDTDSASTVRQTRGVVFDGDNVVMKTFGHTPEFNEFDAASIALSLGEHTIPDCMIFESREGALIRVFSHKSKWYVATHRKLDAFRSKWSSRESFGSIFERALIHHYSIDKEFASMVGEAGASDPTLILKLFLDKLDPEYTYTFLISNTEENRIVCEAPQYPVAYYAGSFSPSGNAYTMFDEIPLPRPQRLFFANAAELCEHVKKSNPRLVQGVLIVSPRLETFKVTSSEYQYLYQLRGNCPSIKFRYLQLRNSGSLLTNFMNLYPLFRGDFAQYETVLQDIARNIHSSYIARFVKKQFVKVSPDEYRVIRDCHGRHISDRSFKVTFDEVQKALTRLTPVTLNRMIKNFLNPRPEAAPEVSPPSEQVEEATASEEPNVIA